MNKNLPATIDDIEALERFIKINPLESLPADHEISVQLREQIETWVEAGNPSIPIVFRRLYAEMALFSFLVARHAQAYLIRHPKPTAENDDHDRVANRNYDRAWKVFQSASSEARNSLKALGYRGEVPYSPISLADLMLKVEKKDGS